MLVAAAAILAQNETLLEAAATAQRTNNNQVLMGAALADDRESPAAGSVDVGRLGVIEAALAVSSTSDPTTHARLLALFAHELIHTARADEREGAARRALAIADVSDDPTLIARIAPPLLFALWDPAWFDVRVSLGVRAAAAADRTDDGFLQVRAHTAAFLVAIECADAAWADRARTRVIALADQIGEPRLRWNAMIIRTFEATMGARFAEADALAAQTFALSTELGDDGAFTIYAAEIFVLLTFAGRHDELFPLVDQALQQSPNLIAFRLAYAIISTFVGRTDEAQAILDSGTADGFATVPNDYLWKTTIIGYAIVAIELNDARAAALLFPILEPFGREVAYNSATSQGPIAAYLGKLASLLGRHDVADSHLHTALAIATSFGWHYHRATTLVGLALSRRRRLGALDDETAAWLNEASAICTERGLRSVANQIERMRN